MLIQISYTDPFEISFTGKAPSKTKFINILHIVDVDNAKKGCKVKMSDGKTYHVDDTSDKDFIALVNEYFLESKKQEPIVVIDKSPSDGAANDPPEGGKAPEDEGEGFFVKRNLQL